MNLNRLKNFLFTLSVLSLLLADNSYAQVPYKPENNFVKGGQFKDLFLPMPIHKKLTHKNIWGAKNALPRDVDNGVEDNEWSYWGPPAATRGPANQWAPTAPSWALGQMSAIVWS